MVTKSLTFKFMGNTQVLHKRFIEREKSPERGQVNTMWVEPSCDDFDKWCHNLDAVDVGGEIVKVDTSDFNAIDLNSYSEFARRFVDA